MRSDGVRLRRSVYTTLSFVALIWLVKIVEFTFNLDFSELGILPRTLRGSVGIITGPLVHGNILHLLSNTFPILVLGIGLFYFYDRIALHVWSLIYLITGFWVWIAAREAYHIGASGLIYGLLTFLLFSGFFRRDSRTLAISFIVLFLYGTTLFSGVLPSEPGVSWESHLMGAIAGLFCAIYFKKSQISTYEVMKKPLDEEGDNLKGTQVYQYHIKETGNNIPGKKRQPQHYTYTLTQFKAEKKD